MRVPYAVPSGRTSNASQMEPPGVAKGSWVLIRLTLGSALASQVKSREVNRPPAQSGCPGNQTYCMWCGSFSTASAPERRATLTTFP